MSRLAVDRSRELRQNATDVERILWKELRSRRFAGYKFRRQYPIDPYIVDFCCLRHRLVIELDGGQHAENESQDRVRTAFLEAKGFKVLRFWNTDVLQKKEAIMQLVLDALIPPSPQPSPKKGEGV